MFSLMPFERDRSLDRYFNAMERNFFRDEAPVLRCRTDIKDQGDSYLLEAELPGFSKEEIKVDMEDGRLTIHAEHSEDQKKEDKSGYLCQERHYGAYTRSFDTTGVDVSRISAAYKDGILSLTLPKMEEAKPQRQSIEIQ